MLDNKYLVVSRWTYSHEGNQIEVFNGLGACHMSINGKICDMKEGYKINRAHLRGTLHDGKSVEAKYSNLMQPKCSVFVEGKLLTPDDKN